VLASQYPQMGVLTNLKYSLPLHPYHWKAGATEDKGGERERESIEDVQCWCSLGLDWVWTGYDTIKVRCRLHNYGVFTRIHTYMHLYRQ
jgi:hypothetical protein